MQWRREGIGGSDAPAVCSMDPWKGPLSIYLDKVGLLPLEDREESETMRWGRLLEAAITEEFSVTQGLYVGGHQMPVANEKIPWLRATLDGYVFDSQDEDAKPIGLLETKTASQRSREWEDEHGEPRIPDHVEVQVQHQLAASDLSLAYVAVLLMWPVPRLRVMQLERDDAAIRILTEIEAEFWDRVQRKLPPQADTYDATAHALRTAYAKTTPASIELSEHALRLIRARTEADKLERVAKDRKQLAENELMVILGEHEVGVHDGRVVVTWKSYEQRRLDSEALRAHHPRIADRFTKTSIGRRFSFKWKSIIDTMGQEPEEE